MPAGPRLPIRDSYRDALHTYRTHLGRTVGIALVLLIPAEAISTAARYAHENLDTHAVTTIVLVAILALLDSVASSFGSAFYAGVIDHTVHADRHGHAAPPVGHIARRLPYWRIVGVSVLAALLVALGFIAFVIPGFVLMTMLSIVAPVLVIEDLGVRAALRRSWRLVRPQFWRVVAVVTIPMLVESFAVEGVAAVVGHTVLAELAVHGVLGTLVFALVLLLEVHTAHWLVDEDRRSR